MSSDIETATKADEEKAELIMARTVCNEAVNVLIDTHTDAILWQTKEEREAEITNRQP